MIVWYFRLLVHNNQFQKWNPIPVSWRSPLPVASAVSSTDDCLRRLPWLQRHAWTRPASVSPAPPLTPSGSTAAAEASWLGARERAAGGRRRSTNGENGCNGTVSSTDEPWLSKSLWPAAAGGPRPSRSSRLLSARRTSGSRNRNVLWTPAHPPHQIVI